MKAKIGNRVLVFLGTITFELYLVHTIFVELFSRAFIGFLKPVWFCSNVVLYILIVTVLSIPLAVLLKRVLKKIVK